MGDSNSSSVVGIDPSDETLMAAKVDSCDPKLRLIRAEISSKRFVVLVALPVQGKLGHSLIGSRRTHVLKSQWQIGNGKTGIPHVN